MSSSRDFTLSRNMTKFEDLVVQVMFVTSGSIALITSIVAIFVILLHPHLRRSYVLFLGLALSDFMNGLGFLTSGLNKLLKLQLGTLFTQTTSFKCIKEPEFIIQTLGLQYPIITTCLLNVERLLAVKTPVWYRNRWTFAMSMTVSLMAFGFCLLSSTMSVVAVFSRGEVNVSGICTSGIATGVTYAAYHYGLIVTVGTLSLVLSLNTVKLVRDQTLRLRKKFLNPLSTVGCSIIEQRRMRKQQRLAVTVTVISVLNFMLTVVPNLHFLLLTINWSNLLLDTLTTAVIRNFFCLNSIFTVFSFIAVNPEFRSALVSSLQLHKNSVMPFQAGDL